MTLLRIRVQGLYMAVDLGGTNFRVCSIQLHGNTTFSLAQTKVPIPRSLMKAPTAQELFAFLAKQIEAFLKQHHEEHYLSHMERRGSSAEGFRDEEIFSLGFTFSFPVHQVGINRGTLIRWTKGFDIPDAIGKDVCSLLQTEIDALHLPVKVAALVNDTVGTLMARSYTSPGKTGTLLGAIFGTGTNGAYVERLARITKLTGGGGGNDADESAYDASTGEMIVNTEWGSFDNPLAVLPNTPYDAGLDAVTPNPGVQMFEKRVSGMFLGEILRRALLALRADPHAALFGHAHSGLSDLHSTARVAPDSPLLREWGVDTSFLSTAHGDASSGLRLTRQALERELGVTAASVADAEAVRELCTAIGRRAARLSAVAIGAIVVASGKLAAAAPASTSTATGAPAGQTPQQASASAGDGDDIDVGVDGSLVEFFPNFEDYIREALREIDQIGAKGEKRIRIGIAKDGSGVGAALIALVADKKGTQAPPTLKT